VIGCAATQDVRDSENFGGAEMIFRAAEGMMESRAKSIQVFWVLAWGPDVAPEPWQLGRDAQLDGQQELAGWP
jgi:hypothetical protein